MGKIAHTYETTRRRDSSRAIPVERMQIRLKLLEDTNAVLYLRNQDLTTRNKSLEKRWDSYRLLINSRAVSIVISRFVKTNVRCDNRFTHVINSFQTSCLKINNVHRLEDDAIKIEKLEENVSLLQNELSNEKRKLAVALTKQTVRCMISIWWNKNNGKFLITMLFVDVISVGACVLRIPFTYFVLVSFLLTNATIKIYILVTYARQKSKLLLYLIYEFENIFGYLYM